MPDQSDLTVTPGALEALAAQHDRAADSAEQTAAVTTDLHREVWKSYGPLFVVVNEAFVYAETQRRGALRRINSQCTGHAAKLRAAADAYGTGDAILSKNLDNHLT